VITVSSFSKKDIVKSYGLAADKIVVAHNGVGEQYQAAKEEVIVSTRQKYSSGKPYFLFVGSLQPRKNIDGLLTGFDLFKSSHPETKETKLLIVGAKHFWTSKMEEAYANMTFKEDVIFLGRVSGKDLVDIYGSALGLVYVPFFEGFGLPILEGFKSQVPVITSNITSMPEVAGDAAIQVDPKDHNAIGQAMTRVHKDDSLRKELIKKGVAQAALFTWDHTEEIIWGEIEKLVHG